MVSESKFVYVTYIRTTAERLWEALLEPQFTRQYWFGITLESSWSEGAAWRMRFADGTIADSGEIIQIEKPRRMIIKWRNEFRPELKAEGYSRCTIELEPVEGAVKLSVIHEIEQPHSKFIDAVSGGWPKILSSLKSMLETGQALEQSAAARN